MDYRKYILQSLLQIYENSTAFITGSFRRRILLHPQRVKLLAADMENSDKKKTFLHDLEALKQEGLLDYSWQKFEAGNLVDCIWLNPECLSAAYHAAAIRPLHDELSKCRQKLNALKDAVTTDWILYYLSTSLERICDAHKLPTLCKRGGGDDYSKLLLLLKEIDILAGNTYERVFSRRVFGDSKYFEKYLKSKLLSILKSYFSKDDTEYSEEELLLIAGLEKYPEILEFTGSVQIMTADGTVDYRLQTEGAYINSRFVSKITALDISAVDRILFIENKANYVWYVDNKRSVNELVIFHGGFYSRMKGLWFTKIVEAANHSGHSIIFSHWGDIDLGGMQIFERLKSNIVPTLKTYQMDTKTYLTYLSKGKPINSKDYLQRLKVFLAETNVSKFKPLIEQILEHKIIIEQEALIEEI